MAETDEPDSRNQFWHDLKGPLLPLGIGGVPPIRLQPISPQLYIDVVIQPRNNEANETHGVQAYSKWTGKANELRMTADAVGLDVLGKTYDKAQQLDFGDFTLFVHAHADGTKTIDLEKKIMMVLGIGTLVSLATVSLAAVLLYLSIRRPWRGRAKQRRQGKELKRHG